MKKIKVIYRHPETGYLEPVETNYEGDVPPKVWKNLNRQFLKLDAGKYFYPADGMDAYHDAIREVEETVLRIIRGEIVLEKATPTTYLTSVAYRTPCNFHQTEVEPMRETYRAVERKTVGKGAVGEDGFDIDNYDGTQDNPDQTMTDACGEKCHESVPAGSALTAQRLVEQMIGTPWAHERAERAASILEEIYLHLPERPVRAFRAFVAEDGHFPRAAKRAHIGINRYYREWPQWLALADSGVGKDYPRKVNMNLATEVGIMPTMADRFASAEGLEDALLIHPASFFQVDEIDTLFQSLNEKKDSAVEKIYGALLQFATSSDTTYAMRKKAIQQTGGKAGKFDKIRAMGIREPHLTMLGCAIPKYLYSALSERAMENGLLSRCLILEAGARGKAGNPHAEPFSPELLAEARSLVSHGGFEGLDLESLEVDSGALGDRALPCGVVGADPRAARHPDPITVAETPEALAKHNEVTAKCEALYDAAETQAEKALWTRGAEKTARLALLYAISENVYEPLITPKAVEWGWAVVEHLTRRMLYQASVYVHDNEFDALRQKALRQLRTHGGEMTHGQLLRNMHIDSDSMRRVIDTLAHRSVFEGGLITDGKGVQHGDVEVGGKVYHFAAGYGKPVRRDGDNLTQEFLNGLPEKWIKGKLELDVTGMARLGVTSEELAAEGLVRAANNVWSLPEPLAL